MSICSVCGKYVQSGGLCYRHGKAFADYYEEMKYQEEEKDE